MVASSMIPRRYTRELQKSEGRIQTLDLTDPVFCELCSVSLFFSAEPRVAREPQDRGFRFRALMCRAGVRGEFLRSRLSVADFEVLEALQSTGVRGFGFKGMASGSLPRPRACLRG